MHSCKGKSARELFIEPLSRGLDRCIVGFQAAATTAEALP
jgi:hypothetical protein